MVRRSLVLLAGLLVCFASANDFRLNVDAGEVILVQNGQRVTKNDSADFNFNDSILISAEHQVSIPIERNSRLLLKGPLQAVLTGDKSALKIIMDEGQLFLDRNEESPLGTVQIISKGFSFIPIGTSAAVKTTSSGNPTTAVLKGKIRMQAPSGEAVMVEEGSFGSVDSNGKLVFGKLSPRAIESLQDWASGKVDAKSQEVAMDSETAEPAPETLPVAPPVVEQSAPVSHVSDAESAPVEEAAPKAEKPEETDETKATTPEKKPEKKAEKAKRSAKATVAASANETTPLSAAQDEPQRAEEREPEQSGSAEKAAITESKPAGGVSTAPSSPQWEIGAGMVTIDNEQWTRLAIGVDVPIWKFGVFFDVEFFIDNEGRFSDKGWNFKNDWVEALTRKIRYVRFGHEEDPLFIKFGGLSSVTLGYGFIVDRFTNMLHYPDEKLLGLQFYLNDISPIGITLQTVLADFKDFRNDGGVFGARLAFTPLKMSSIPIVKGVSIGGTYATDLNQYAPARKWDVRLPASVRMLDYIVSLTGDSASAIDTIISWGENDPREDYESYRKEKRATRADDPFGLIGGDIGIPLIRTSLLNLDLYGQAAIRDDGEHGWGIGLPGVAVKVWKLWANVEYRRVQGRFTPGYFGPYYLDERLTREPFIATKEMLLTSDTLNGIFGKLGFNIANVLVIDGTYQYLIGREPKDKSVDRHKDQRFEAVASLGDMILQKVPKLNRAEAYYYKTNIGILEDDFFEKTEYRYLGYRAGFEITQGASLIWDSRYGYKRDENNKLVSNNFVSIQTAITF